MKRWGVVAATIAATLLCGAAEATVTTYTANGTLRNGVAFAGSFSVNDSFPLGSAYYNALFRVGGSVFRQVVGQSYVGASNSTGLFSVTISDYTDTTSGSLFIYFDASHTGFTLNAVANQSLSPYTNLIVNGQSTFLQTGSITSSANAIIAVPEPATWAMFIGGFGLIGGSMRRRRHNIRVAFA